MSAYTSTIQKMYVAFFNRPADFNGLLNWEAYAAGKSEAALVSAIAKEFAKAAEYTIVFKGMEYSQIVTKIYNNLLNRDPDIGGLTNWVNHLVKGESTIDSLVTDILTVAGVDDLKTINNKVAAATAFTNALDTVAEANAYSGAAANAVAAQWLAAVGTDASLAAATTPAALTAVTTNVLNNSGNAVGQTFTLTSAADTLDPNAATATLKTSANDDTIRAVADGDLGSADYIDGGAGKDTLNAAITANSQTLAPTIKNVESINLTVTAADTKGFTFSATDVAGATTVTVKGAGAVSATQTAGVSDERITVSGLAKTTTLGISGGKDTVTATGSEIAAVFTGAVAADTQKVAISDAGKTANLVLTTAETVEITATGNGTTGANTIGTLTAAAVKTLNLKGTGDLTIGASDLAATVTVDATAATGKVSFAGESGSAVTFKGGSGDTTVVLAGTATNTVTTGAGADNVTLGTGTDAVSTGAGNDRVNVGAASNVTAGDKIDGGDGVDTIAVSDTTINLATKTALALGATNFERVETTAATAVSINFQTLNAYDLALVSAAMTTGTAAAGAAGAASVSAVLENADALQVAAIRTGEVGGAAASATSAGNNGGAGIALTAYLDNGANIGNLTLVGNADITGGAGSNGGATSGNGGNGGTGIDAANMETLNLVISGTQLTTGTADTVTIRGGAAGTGTVAGTAGSDLVVGTNATINVTSILDSATTGAAKHNNLDLGTVKGTNVTINASNFEGILTVTAVDGNTTINGGKAADVLAGGAGSDTINGGAGNDSITGNAGADFLTGGAGRDAFIIGTAGHSGTTTYDKISDFGKVTTAATAAEVTLMTGVTAFQAAATAKGGADADVLDLVGTATLVAASSGADVATASANAGKTITANLSAKGILTIGGGDAALVDTLVEWVGIANQVAGTAGNVVAFQFNNNTYVFQQGTTDDLVELTGVTGVTGITLVGGSAAAAVGDIFVI